MYRVDLSRFKSSSGCKKGIACQLTCFYADEFLPFAIKIKFTPLSHSQTAKYFLLPLLKGFF